MDNYQIVNGSQLLNHVNKKVSLTGYASTSGINTLSFEVKATDSVIVKVIMKRPLDKPIEGYVEVRGIYQNKAIMADNLILFENSEFDEDGYNTLCSLLHSVPNLWKTKQAVY